MRPTMLRASLVLIFATVLAGVSFADLAKLDPLARAALGRLRAGEDVARLVRDRAAANEAGELDVFICGSVSRAELEAAGAVVRSAVPGVFTAFIPVDAIERVAALRSVRLIRGAAPLELELDQSTAAIGAAALRGAGPNFSGANGAGVLIGDVDSGVDFHHGDFDNVSGNTRLVRIWDQTVPGRPPAGFNYGYEWTAGEIDAGTCTEVDDDGHGTHVLGIAGGDGSQTGGAIPAYTFAGIAPKADLVMVKHDFLNDTHLMDGVQYCFDLATARGQSAVVNLSLGSQYGPHDGTDPLELGLAAMTGPGRIIVKSAGNDRGSNRHAEIVAAGPGTDATMSVSGSAVGRRIWIDGYYESTDNLTVRIRTPDGTFIGPIVRGNANATWPNGQNTPSGTVYLENGYTPTVSGDYQVYAEITVASGENMDGTWTFTFIPVAAPNGQVDLWKFFSDGGVTASWVAGLQNEELISTPGNAEELITVAAWVTKVSWTDCSGQPRGYASPPTVGTIAPFSSPGPTRDGRNKPDIAAPGMGIASTTSFDVSPICGLFYLNDALNHRIDQGTSMAAPHVTGSVALLLQNFGPLTPAQAKAHLFSRARADAQTGTVWNADWGNGKLYLDGSVETLLSLFQAAFVPEGVELRWQLGDPGRFTSVVLERAAGSEGPWRSVVSERRFEGGVTVVLDRSAVPGTTLFYRLVATPADGAPMFFGPLEVAGGTSLARFALASVRPNPARSVGRIDFTVPRSSAIRLSLFDLQGREVAVLAAGIHRPGRYQAAWNGAGGSLRAGLYFVRLRTPDGDLTQRVALTP